jgi:hypothetical protein
MRQEDQWRDSAWMSHEVGSPVAKFGLDEAQSGQTCGRDLTCKRQEAGRPVTWFSIDMT